MSLLYAATYPERTSALVLYGSYARRAWAPDHPFGVTSERMQGILEAFEKDWGTSVAMEIWSPSMSGDEAYKQWRGTYLRLAASPGAAISVMRMNMESMPDKSFRRLVYRHSFSTAPAIDSRL